MGYGWNNPPRRFNDYRNLNGISDDMVQEMERKNLETSGGYQAKVTGDIGELTISSVMRSLPDGYHVVDDVLLQTKRGSTQLDHIIVSQFGLVVVETKNHKGMIFGDCFGQVWTQVLSGRGRFKFYSPVKQNAGHIQNLAQQIRIPMSYMCGAIVFTNPEVNLVNVNCPFCFTVDRLYDFVLSFTNPIFTPVQVEKVLARIDKVDTNGYLNRQKHVAYVQGLKDKRGY